MSKLRKSPYRNTFQKKKYLERQAEKGKTPENDEDTLDMLAYYSNSENQKFERENDIEWQKNNLEYDLRTNDYIIKKCEDKAYAQNLYAALCNNEFIKNDVWPLLREEKWSCSWRYAGGIIADIREEGDYIDWYCSGIRGDMDDEEFQQLNKEAQDIYIQSKKFVGESVVTDEIRQDLLKVGWIVSDEDLTD